jgi:hypothetical protein
MGRIHFYAEKSPAKTSRHDRGCPTPYERIEHNAIRREAELDRGFEQSRRKCGKVSAGDLMRSDIPDAPFTRGCQF